MLSTATLGGCPAAFKAAIAFWFQARTAPELAACAETWSPAGTATPIVSAADAARKARIFIGVSLSVV
jgi:hypothetical protein